MITILIYENINKIDILFLWYALLCVQLMELRFFFFLFCVSYFFSIETNNTNKLKWITTNRKQSFSISSLCFCITATPNREHVFHVKFPDAWSQSDLNNHFRKFGPVATRWIDNSSAFVSLMHRENAAVVLKTIDKMKNVQVTTFAAFSATKIECDDVSNVCSAYLCHFVCLSNYSTMSINAKHIFRMIRLLNHRWKIHFYVNERSPRYQRTQGGI